MTRGGKRSLLLVNGPNLNLLGTREPHIYGAETLQDVVDAAKKQCDEEKAHFDSIQSNWEGAVIDRIQAARTDGTDAIVINPGAWTHYSVALRDALLSTDVAFIECHISNVHAREEFRHRSLFSDKAQMVIMGAGVRGYRYAIDLALSNTTKFPSRPEPLESQELPRKAHVL